MRNRKIRNGVREGRIQKAPHAFVLAGPVFARAGRKRWRPVAWVFVCHVQMRGVGATEKAAQKVVKRASAAGRAMRVSQPGACFDVKHCV